MAHESAYNHYKDFLRNFRVRPGMQILDVGGEGGEYESITKVFGHDYTALNTGSVGFGVILGKGEEYRWPIKKNMYDAVISSSTFEHIPLFWFTFMEMVRVCKPDGYIYINAPSTGPEHYHVDCWRFKRDGMKALADWSGVELVAAWTDKGTEWCDTVGIFRKH